MKYFLTLLGFILSIYCIAQNSYPVTMNGIAGFKLGMKKEEAEKLLGQEIKLINTLKKEDDLDTITCKYKDMDLTFIFEKDYNDDKNSNIIIREIMTNSAFAKTPSGIGIGDDKFKIITTYEAYTIWIVPAYENNYTTRSKTKTDVYVHGDESGDAIIFHLNMNKVESISVKYDDAD